MRRAVVGLFLSVCVVGCGTTGGGGPDARGAVDVAPDVRGGADVDGAVDAGPDVPAVPTVTLTGDVVRDKIAGGWVGQMVGVVRAGLTEFVYQGRIIPEAEVPHWERSAIVAAYVQDDLYVEVPMLVAMAEVGPLAGWDVLGEAFAATEFPLWHANEAARNNLLAGIAAPESGHYRNNPHADDIDWQIEADFLGLMAPGMPRVAAGLAWRAGHVMNYGDGVYGGVMVAAMQAEAFVARDVRAVVEAGLAALPAGSTFRQAMDDVVAYHDAHPDDFEGAWQAVYERWGTVDRCPYGLDEPYNIDAKLNAAWVLVGLLYGDGDFERSMVTGMRCGDDSDCTSSTVGGILGTLYGRAAIPEEYVSALDEDTVFQFTTSTLADCLALEEALARRAVVLAGGRVEGIGAAERWVLPRHPVTPVVLEQWPTVENEAPVIESRGISVEGRTVRFDVRATDADGIAGAMWSFGDLAWTAEAAPVHTYGAPGTYDAVVWVTDGVGNTSWAAVPVFVVE